MQPLSRRVRRTYLVALIVLFFLALPVVILYASGYRFKGELGIVKTGGILLSVPYQNAAIMMNGEWVGESGLLRRNFYISDLTPGTYVIEVSREGDRSWHRVLFVESQLVTDAEVFLLQNETELVELIVGETAASSTRRVSRAVFDTYRVPFKRLPATTTPSRDGTLFIENGDIVLKWVEEDRVSPSSFFARPSRCALVIPIEKTPQQATNASFFARWVVYTTREGGAFVTEGDIRPTVIAGSLYPKRGAGFRIVEGRLIVKDGERLYEILSL